MPDLDLEARLHRLAQSAEVAPGHLDQVLDRASTHSSRQRRTGAAALTLTLAVVAVAGGVALSRDSGDTGLPVSSGSATAFTWTTSTPSSALGMANGLAGTGGRFAVSTAPGAYDPTSDKQTPRVIYRTDDGVNYQQTSQITDDLFLSDLAGGTSGSRLFAVGTGVAARGAGKGALPPLVAAWSDDGGATLSRTQLPLDTTAIDRLTTRAGVLAIRVASGQAGTVAMATLHGELDVPRVVPAGTDLSHGWAMSPTGVDLVGPPADPACPAGYTDVPEGARGEDMRQKFQGFYADGPRLVDNAYCFTEGGRGDAVMVTPQQARGVTRSFTWAELGLSGDALAAVAGRPVLFHAPAGSTEFVRADDVAIGDGSISSSSLTADAGGFRVLFTTYHGQGQPSPLTVLRSTDGRRWADEGDGPPGLAWATGAGELAGRPTVVGSDRSGDGLIASMNPDGTWSTQRLSVIAGEAGAGRNVNAYVAAFGPLGLVMAGSAAPQRDVISQDDIDLLVLATTDGRQWDVRRAADLVGEPVLSADWATADADGFRVSLALGRAADGKAQRRVVLQGRPAA